MNFKTHKDKNPADTVNMIREILSDLGISMYESEWFSVTGNCHSVTISCMDLPECSTNGKGVTMQFALASAYAEFMERLQAELLIKRKFGLMKTDYSYPGDVRMSLEEYAVNHNNVLEYIIYPQVMEHFKDHVADFFPVYDVTENKSVYLPYFITLACISTGLCAGNTPEEAICQGICEIFERAVVREIYKGNIELPTIPLSLLKDLEIYRIIEDIAKKGYEIVVKDCSLGNKFPVVGVIMINKKIGTYMCNFGSDPEFEVALQRCLTELFQGKNESSLKVYVRSNRLDFSSSQFEKGKYDRKNANLTVAYRKSLAWGAIAEHPNRIFFSGKVNNEFKSAFQDKFVSHKSSLNFLTKIIAKSNYKMYVRDNSFLGFPAYRVFIPELAVTERINSEKFRVMFVERHFMKTVLMKFKNTPLEDLQKFAEYLEVIFNDPENYYWCRLGFTHTITGLITDKSSNYRRFDHIGYLLGLLFYRLGDVEKSFHYLDIFIKEQRGSLENLDYYLCALMYLKFKITGKSDDDIILILKNNFGEKLSHEVMEDMKYPEDTFKYFTLPDCGDCGICPIKNECHYEKWRFIDERIVEKIASSGIVQDDVSKLFKDLRY